MKGEEVANGGGKCSGRCWRIRDVSENLHMNIHFSATRLIMDSDWHQKDTWHDHFINVTVIRSCYRLYYKFTFWPKLLSKRIGSGTNLLFCGWNACSVIWKEWVCDDSPGDYSLSAQDYTWWINPFLSKMLSIHTGYNPLCIAIHPKWIRTDLLHGKPQEKLQKHFILWQDAALQMNFSL